MNFRSLSATALLFLAFGGPAFSADTAPAQDENSKAPSNNILSSPLPYDINLLDKYGPNGFNKDGQYADILKVPKLDVPVTKEQAKAQADAVDKLMPMLPAGYNDPLTTFPVDKNGNQISWADVQSGKAPLSDVFRVCSMSSRSCSISAVDEMIKGLQDAPAYDTSAAIDPSAGTTGGKGAPQDNVCSTPGCTPLSMKEMNENGLQACDQVCPIIRGPDGKPMNLTQENADSKNQLQVDGYAEYLQIESDKASEPDGTSGGTDKSAPQDDTPRYTPPDTIGGGTSGGQVAPANPDVPSVPHAKPVTSEDAGKGFWQDYARALLNLLQTPFDPSSGSEIGPENRVWYARDRFNAKDPSLKAWSQLHSAAEGSRGGSAVQVDGSESDDILGADQLSAETGQAYDANATGRAPIAVSLRNKYNKPESSTLPFESQAVTPIRE